MSDPREKVTLMVDAEVERLMKLLDVGIDAARKGDFDSALMAAKEGLASAQRLSSNIPICLPDRSGERI